MDVRTNPILEVTNTGVRTSVAEYELDVLVFATGFDAMTGSMRRMNVTGIDGMTLEDKWENGPTNYLGFVVAGFPNLFMVHGPGSPSVLAQMITTGEWQVDWIVERIEYMESNGYTRIEATTEAEIDWEDEVQTIADATLFKQADSWYVGANVPGKPRVFMVYVGGFDRYKMRCEQAVDADYRGFVLC